jgi:hypothetical protein
MTVRLRYHADGRTAIRLPGSVWWLVCDRPRYPEDLYPTRYVGDAYVSGDGWIDQPGDRP